MDEDASLEVVSDVEVMEATLCAADIPGAELAEPFEKHPVPSLCWWLLCRGIKAPASWKKKDLVVSDEDTTSNEHQTLQATQIFFQSP